MKPFRQSLTESTAPVPDQPRVGDIPAEILGSTVGLACEAILRDFPGVALVTDGAGRVLGASEAAAPLVADIGDGAGGHVQALIAETLASGPRYESVTLDAGGAFDLAFVPLIGDGVLVVGHEATLVRNLQQALIDSRRRYKDLVECSSDFAWEVGADGAFVFVSPRSDALGYEAGDLVGRQPQDLVHERHDRTSPLPFYSAEPTEHATVWLRTADGSSACFETASIPLLDDDGRWAGARGVCRDVTEARARDAALTHARQRERLVTGLVNTIREEVNPDKLLARAAEVTGQALEATLCWIYCIDADDGKIELVAVFGEAPEDGSDATSIATLRTLADEPEPVEITIAGAPALAAVARQRQGANGAICVARSRRAEAWSVDDRTLLAAVAEHLGIAIEQIANHEALIRLSRTDDLTGLLNRRAFTEELERRHGHSLRTRRGASLLYIDLDNFKLVNDAHGHQLGDAALKEWAGLLAGSTRVGDVTARLGGDEFSVWLEETGEAGAVAKAAELVAAGERLERYSGDPERPLCLSVGVAVFDPTSGESLDQLIARADAAMYGVKHSGKGDYAVAASVPSTSV